MRKEGRLSLASLTRYVKLCEQSPWLSFKHWLSLLNDYMVHTVKRNKGCVDIDG